jgi:flagellin
MSQEVERLTVSTTFNGNHIIKGRSSIYDLQIGTGGDPQVDRIRYDMGKIMDSTNNFGINSVNLRSKESALTSLTKIDHMMSEISSSRAQLGAMSVRMNSSLQNTQVSKENLSASNSKIRDADMALETANKAKTQIASSASLAMLRISNDQPGLILKLVGG